MIIIADLIFMTIDAMFDKYSAEGEDELLTFDDFDAVAELIDEVNEQFEKFNQFDNFKGGYCLTNTSCSCLTIIMYIADNEGINVCTKNFEISY